MQISVSRSSVSEKSCRLSLQRPRRRRRYAAVRNSWLPLQPLPQCCMAINRGISPHHRVRARQVRANVQKEAFREQRGGIDSFEENIARISLAPSGAGAGDPLSRRADESPLDFFNRLSSATDEQLAILYVAVPAPHERL